MLMPILEGLDGVQKMSKSLGNAVGVTEPPIQMFGKLMSIPDDVMPKYYELLLAEAMPEGHPMDAKKQLARRIVARFHSETDAQHALDDFNARFSQRDLASADLPAYALPEGGADIVSIVVDAYAKCFQTARSRSDARRLVEQGSVQWRGEKVGDAKARFEPGAEGILKLDKTRAVRVG
jgi:tyrosyl-tRNA synthetase